MQELLFLDLDPARTVVMEQWVPRPDHYPFKLAVPFKAQFEHRRHFPNGERVPTHGLGGEWASRSVGG